MSGQQQKRREKSEKRKEKEPQVMCVCGRRPAFERMAWTHSPLSPIMTLVLQLQLLNYPLPHLSHPDLHVLALLSLSNPRTHQALLFQCQDYRTHGTRGHCSLSSDRNQGSRVQQQPLSLVSECHTSYQRTGKKREKGREMGSFLFLFFCWHERQRENETCFSRCFFSVC